MAKSPHLVRVVAKNCLRRPVEMFGQQHKCPKSSKDFISENSVNPKNPKPYEQ